MATEQLEQYALSLGSDCPFFIQNQPVFATGRGEIFSPVACNLKGYYMLLVNPAIHVPTGWAFGQLTPKPAEPGWQQLLQQPVSQWQALGLVNDFEAPVIKNHPVLQQVKQYLQQMGAAYVAMSGSGSTFFGIFAQKPPIPDVFANKGMIVKLVPL
jgi:4-diphosphocytidyl-2-C-methyl-D-erythritol kinase